MVREPEVRTARAFRLRAPPLGALVALALAPACPVNDQPVGAKGREGVATFVAETDLVFSATLVVGSHTTLTVAAVDDEAPLPADAFLHSANESVLTLGEPDEDGAWPLTAAGPGKADLELIGADGTRIDAIEVEAAVPGATTLVDGDLLGASQVVDARLPLEGWGFLVERDLTLLVSAVDRCGGDLLDLHASTLRTADGTAATFTVDESAPATFTANATEAGDVDLLLETPGLEPLTFPVQAIDPGDVDEVRVAAASADDTGRMSLWGRAFANDVEVVGPLRFGWRADPRVALSAVEGLAVEAQVSFPAEGEPPDDRPATVTAEVLGEEGTTDLFTARQEVDRGTPAREVVLETPASTGCGGEACDPFAAAGLLGAFALRRRLLPISRRRARATDG